MDRLRAKVEARVGKATRLDAPSSEAIVAFLNECLGDEMLDWVLRGTELGKKAAAKNMWSAGAWAPKTAELVSLSSSALQFRVGVAERGKQELSVLTTELPLPREVATVDELRQALLQLGSGERGAGASAVVLRLPGASDDWSLPDDLWLNTTPYPRSVRQMFYTDVVEAMQAAVADPTCSRLMKVTVTPPELNMEMDSYRVGTLLELIRECALSFAEAGLKTRVCVQGSMGQGALMGVPRVLSGVRKVLTMMDWQAEVGEDYEGLLGEVQRSAAADGTDAAEGTIRFGAVGAAEVAADDDVLLLLAPQSMVGASIHEPLRAMAERAEAQGTAVILINPLLQEGVS